MQATGDPLVTQSQVGSERSSTQHRLRTEAKPKLSDGMRQHANREAQQTHEHHPFDGGIRVTQSR